MSRQFNYELDERQIKTLMKNSQVEFQDSVWNKFESLSFTEQKTNAQFQSFIPKINININRSVVVSILFVALVGGLSAMLFSFIDFKKKEAVVKEKPLIPNAENVIKQKAEIKPESKKEERKTIVTMADSVKLDSTLITTTINQPTQIDSVIKPTEQLANTTNSVETIQEVKKDIVTNPVRKKKKIVFEELQTIKASTNLNESVIEPELKIN
jgi:hypothetical protein